MTPASLLLRVYYERLHERMEMRRSELLLRIDDLLAEELIRRVGAFPDRSIIAGYCAEPTLRKLADYVVARGIEDIIHESTDS